MENLLKKVSEQYNEEVEFKVQTVSGMIEPLLIIFLGLIIGRYSGRYVPADVPDQQ